MPSLLAVDFTVQIKSPKEFNKEEVIKFDQVITNHRNGYDVTSGIFKAPSSGTYLFIVTVTNEAGKEAQMALHRKTDVTDSTLCKTYAGEFISPFL